jgi:hypothetical protein
MESGGKFDNTVFVGNADQSAFNMWQRDIPLRQEWGIFVIQMLLQIF